jgi:YD repeat-containing protein
VEDDEAQVRAAAMPARSVQTMPDGTRVEYRLDGTLARQWNPDGTVVTYDDHGRPVRRDGAAGLSAAPGPGSGAVGFGPATTGSGSMRDQAVSAASALTGSRDPAADRTTDQTTDHAAGHADDAAAADPAVRRRRRRPWWSRSAPEESSPVRGVGSPAGAAGSIAPGSADAPLVDGTVYTAFDDAGRPVAGTDPLGRPFILTYGPRGEVTRHTAAERERDPLTSLVGPRGTGDSAPGRTIEATSGPVDPLSRATSGSGPAADPTAETPDEVGPDGERRRRNPFDPLRSTGPNPNDPRAADPRATGPGATGSGATGPNPGGRGRTGPGLSDEPGPTTGRSGSGANQIPPGLGGLQAPPGLGGFSPPPGLEAAEAPPDGRPTSSGTTPPGQFGEQAPEPPGMNLARSGLGAPPQIATRQLGTSPLTGLAGGPGLGQPGTLTGAPSMAPLTPFEEGQPGNNAPVRAANLGGGMPLTPSAGMFDQAPAPGQSEAVVQGGTNVPTSDPPVTAPPLMAPPLTLAGGVGATTGDDHGLGGLAPSTGDTGNTGDGTQTLVTVTPSTMDTGTPTTGSTTPGTTQVELVPITDLQLPDGQVPTGTDSTQSFTTWTTQGSMIDWSVDLPALQSAISQVGGYRDSIKADLASLKTAFTTLEGDWWSPAGMSLIPLANIFGRAADNFVDVLDDAIARMNSSYQTYVQTEATNNGNLG